MAMPTRLLLPPPKFPYGFLLSMPALGPPLLPPPPPIPPIPPMTAAPLPANPVRAVPWCLDVFDCDDKEAEAEEEEVDHWLASTSC